MDEFKELYKKQQLERKKWLREQWIKKQQKKALTQLIEKPKKPKKPVLEMAIDLDGYIWLIDPQTKKYQLTGNIYRNKKHKEQN